MPHPATMRILGSCADEEYRMQRFTGSKSADLDLRLYGEAGVLFNTSFRILRPQLLPDAVTWMSVGSSLSPPARCSC